MAVRIGEQVPQELGRSAGQRRGDGVVSQFLGEGGRRGARLRGARGGGGSGSDETQWGEGLKERADLGRGLAGSFGHGVGYGA